MLERVWRQGNLQHCWWEHKLLQPQCIAQSWPILRDTMHCSMPGFPVPHHLPMFVQLHVHCISDAIQPSHPLMLSSSALSLAQHKGFSQWVSSSHLDQNTGASASASALPMSILGWFTLRFTGLILLAKGLSEVFSFTTVQRHQFFGALLSLWSSSHNQMWPLGRPQPWLYRPLSAE